MDLMQRRRQLMGMQKSVLDTSPVIERTGFWTRAIGELSDSPDWCVTKFYNTDDIPDGTYRATHINGYIGSDTSSITFQYYFSDGSADFWYFAWTNSRLAVSSAVKRISRISFSIEKTKLKDSYAYIVETGKILFAGKNTPYYGHTNISELN